MIILKDINNIINTHDITFINVIVGDVKVDLDVDQTTKLGKTIHAKLTLTATKNSAVKYLFSLFVLLIYLFIIRYNLLILINKGTIGYWHYHLHWKACDHLGTEISHC